MTGDDDSLLVGVVARAHGNRGSVIVNPETDFPDRRFRAGEVLLVGRGAGGLDARRIREVRFQQGRPIINLEGIETMNDAEALAGAELRVPASALEPLPEGTYYRHDLVGCEVRDLAGGLLGTVTAVEGPLERSHLVVARDAGEVMVPLVDGICVSVSVADRRIVVRPPEGLLDL
jgi:16S rRNA processing protein RimM